MSAARQRLTVDQEPFLAVRSLACAYASGTVIQPHQHDWHQLLYASAGAMSVHAQRQSWMILPGKAVFVPANCRHTIRTWGMVAMRSLTFPLRLSNSSLDAEECRVLSVSSLLREVILQVIATPALDVRLPRHAHLLAVLLDEISQAPTMPLALPLPADARAQALAEHVIAESGGNTTIDQLARRNGLSRRTVERRFSEETGLSFGMWRQKARLIHSVRLLSEGCSVTNAALDSGYASVSAFISAFKQTFGCTPGKM